MASDVPPSQHSQHLEADEHGEVQLIYYEDGWQENEPIRCMLYFKDETYRTVLVHYHTDLKVTDCRSHRRLEEKLNAILPSTDVVEPSDWNYAVLAIHRITSTRCLTDAREMELKSIEYGWDDRYVELRELDFDVDVDVVPELSKTTSKSVVPVLHDLDYHIAKMAKFDDNPEVHEAELRMYEKLIFEGIAPDFLACIHDNGRIVGFLFQGIIGQHPMGDYSARTHRYHRKACLEVLQDLHDLNIVHGDIKPEHFLICESGQALLIDFASATQYDEDPYRQEIYAAELELLEGMFAEHMADSEWRD
jgi:predicted Ser/Thr protein kinase